MKRNMGLMLAALLGSTPALAAENNWDSYVAAQLSPNRVVAKTAAGTVNRHARDITMTLVEARKHWNELSPETQTLARRWLARPDTTGDNLGSLGVVDMTASNMKTTNTAHFKVHYVDCATDGGDAHCASAAYINTVKTALEKVYTDEITTLGYTAPPSDNGLPDNGGSGLYDVYVAEIGSMGIYGYAAPVLNATVSPSYLVIDNDYAGFGYVDPADPMKVTVAHEYFHSVQFGYDSNENSAWMENSSTWVETQVYPTIHDNYQYLGELYTDSNANGQYDAGELFIDRDGDGKRASGSMDYPEAPLDTFSNTVLLQYGRWLWPQYLTEKFGAGVMRDIWVACKATPGENHFAAMSTGIAKKGSTLATAYQEYATWGYDRSKYDDGVNYPQVWVDGVDSGSVDFRSATSYSLGGRPQYHMSTVYLRINDPSGAYRFNSAGATAALTMLVDDGSGTLTSDKVKLSSGAATWTAPAGAAYAIAVVSNVTSTSDCMNWAFKSGTANTSVSSGCSTGGGGGGALDLLALSIAGLLYARRRLA